MSLSVLLVEPDAGFADEIRKALDPVGFQVASLPSGEPAVERCRREPPDLILLAAELPDMSGFSVCNRLKRQHASIPLILYTAEATEAAIETHRATRTRADDYLRRPFEMADLLARAATLLQLDASPPVAPRVAPAPGAADHAARPPPSPLVTGPAAARPATLGRVRVGPRGDPADVFAELPRDPAPPKGGPEERVEYFRERVRARDAFIARARSSMDELRGWAAEIASARDGLETDLVLERRRADDLERRLGDAAQDAAATAARLDDLRRQLQESERNRQAASEVLTETLQKAEATERALEERLSAAEAERTRLEADLASEAEAHAKATAGIEAAHSEERAAFDQERAELEAQASRDRSEAAARLVKVEERAAVLARERDQLTAQGRRLQAELGARAAREEEARKAAEAAEETLRGDVEHARARLEALTGELAEVAARAAALEKEAGQEREKARKLEGDVGRLSRLEPAAAQAEKLREEVAQLRKQVASLTEMARQRAAAAEAAAQAVRSAQTRARSGEERLAAERARLEGEVAKLEAELASARGRAEAAEGEREDLRKRVERQGEDEERRRQLNAAEVEKRHATEAARLRAALGEVERKLEGALRSEAKLKARVAELEKKGQAPADRSAEVARLEESVRKLGVELVDLREENEFLNGEVARFQQKSSDLARQLESMRES